MLCQESKSAKREKKSGGKDEEGAEVKEEKKSNGGACHSHPDQVRLDQWILTLTRWNPAFFTWLLMVMHGIIRYSKVIVGIACYSHPDQVKPCHSF